MADINVNNDQTTAPSVETTDRGLFDFMKKNDDQKPQDDEPLFLASDFDSKVQVSEPEPKKEEVKEEKKHESLLEKLHRSDSSSSSSSSDGEGDDEEKKKKKKEKKGLKDKLKEKLGHKEEDTNVPIEKYEEKPAHVPHVEEVVYSEPSHPEEDLEKKGFMDKIKDKLPGGQKKADEHHETTATTTPTPVVAVESAEKKGFLEKIKDKIPGFSSKEHEEKKEGH